MWHTGFYLSPQRRILHTVDGDQTDVDYYAIWLLGTKIKFVIIYCSLRLWNNLCVFFEISHQL